MKTMSLALSTLLLLTFGAISGTRAQSVAADEGIDTVEVLTVTATVEKIDLEKRKVTLLLDDGKKRHTRSTVVFKIWHKSKWVIT
jgi:Cu/Ag efflux protein CusF